MDDPRMLLGASISPSSLAFLARQVPGWKGSMLVGSLNGMSLQRVSFKQPSQAERREPLLKKLNVRIRDVQQSPDGYLYVATELPLGGTAADGTVLRLEPAEASSARYANRGNSASALPPSHSGELVGVEPIDFSPAPAVRRTNGASVPNTICDTADQHLRACMLTGSSTPPCRSRSGR